MNMLLDEKSKYMKFEDLIGYHPDTPFDLTNKGVVCFVSEWYTEYLVSREIEVDDVYKWDW